MHRIKTILGFKSAQYKKVILLHMKSGRTLRVPCDDCDISYIGDKVSKVSFTGAMNATILWASCDQIEAITAANFSRFTRYI